MFKRKIRYYEKRLIKDISGNEYHIWEIYQLNDMGMGIAIATLHSQEEFDNFKLIYNVEFRQLTSRGME